MKVIKKNEESKVLFDQALQIERDGEIYVISDYNELRSDDRRRLLNILMNEQDNLCAYCGRQLAPNATSIEHLVCQSHNSSLRLNYWNLFAVCDGAEGQRRRDLNGLMRDVSHCDTYRGSRMRNSYFFPFIYSDVCLTRNRTYINPFFEAEKNRTGDITGRIAPRRSLNVPGYPPVEQIISQVIDTLNLNSEVLINARLSRWEEIIKEHVEHGIAWEDLFERYLIQNPKTNFHEFVLLAIHRQL